METAYNCLRAAINMARPGTLYRDFGMAINKVAAQSKCSVVTTYCGHGIGEYTATISERVRAERELCVCAV